ncbi:MAG: hypothetical protein ABI747_03855, partial [Candidatus Moraniibacteriota bacterium]
MYWIYLVLFILIIFTPEFVLKGFWIFGQEDLESLLIFGFGMIGLLLYLGKESALIRTVKEKLFLQRETNQIRKDLSQSYSYIGEMNRKFDIMKNLLIALPTSTLKVFSRQKKDLYGPIFDAVRLLTKSSHLLLVFVETEKGVIREKHVSGDPFPISLLDGARLLGTKKFFWDEGDYCIVRAPEDAFETVAFLVFEKNANRLEYSEVFQIIAA